MRVTVDAAVDTARVRTLLTEGRCNDALALVDRMLAVAPPGPLHADALVLRLGALINLRRRAEYTTTMDAAFTAVRAFPSAGRAGLLHSFAALVAFQNGSLERCVWHLVLGARRLNAVELTDGDIARAWHNLAMAYSYTGFHGHARAAIEKARQVAANLGLSTVVYSAPSIRLRAAVCHDQHGDTEACLRILRDLANDFQYRSQTGELVQMRPVSLRAYGYAFARLAALGDHASVRDLDPRGLLAAEDDSIAATDFGAFGAVCLAIAERRPIEAVARLEAVEPSTALGPAEPYRLRALAHVVAGDFKSAYTEDRRCALVACQHAERLRELFVDGMAARIDHEDLSRSVQHYAGEAKTDPLTGLPNRRHLEEYVTGLVAAGERAVLGVCDLDGFKAVNTVHGHLSGDLVLQRVAGVLNRVMRCGDFVARYGGDEFVVVLKRASRAEANEIARRISLAVNAEDWEALVPGTPIGVTIGWASVSERTYTTVGEAFKAADLAMLRAKARPRAS